MKYNGHSHVSASFLIKKKKTNRLESGKQNESKVTKR